MSAAFVADKRRLGASWGTVARMLGSSEPDTRREYDPTYLRLDHGRPAERPDPAPRDRPGPARDSFAFKVLAAVAGGANTAAAIGEAVGRRSREVSGLIASLRARGLIDARPFSNHGLAYTATARGVRELARARGAVPAEAA